MREIVPPHAQSISRTKVLLDGVVYGRQYQSSRPVPRPALVTEHMERARRQLDAVHLRQTTRQALSGQYFRRRLSLFFRRVAVYVRRFFRKLFRSMPLLVGTPRRALYTSLVGGVSFGMVSMGLIQNLALSDDASAEVSSAAVEVVEAENDRLAIQEELLEQGVAYDPNDDLFLQFFSEATKDEYGRKIETLVKGYPIEDMLPYILEKDRIVSAFLIGIAKKESNWGKRVPVLDGQDCFNYWGYRGLRRLMGTGGHTCFNSRKDAVDTVALRLETLIHSQKLDTPAKLIIWKCGYSCDGHSRESVRKWIADVDMYFSELNQKEE